MFCSSNVNFVLFPHLSYAKQFPFPVTRIHPDSRDVIDLNQRKRIMMDILTQIRKLDLFQGVPAEKLWTLAERSLYRTYKAGEMFIGETDPAHAFYVVITGRVKLYKSSPEGKEQTLNLLGPGDPFGMCTAFAVDSFPVNAMTLEESGLLLIPGQIMEAVAMHEPRLLLNIIRVLSDRLKESMTLIESPVPEGDTGAARLLPPRCPDQRWGTGQNEPTGIDDHPEGTGQDPGSHPGGPVAGHQKNEQCRRTGPGRPIDPDSRPGGPCRAG